MSLYMPVAFAADQLSAISQGSPLFLILCIGFFAYGVWKLLQDRKKPRKQRNEEQKRFEQRFMENVNRNEDLLHGDDFGKPIARTAKPNNAKEKKK